MSKKIITILFFLLPIISIYPQKPWIGNNDFLLAYLKKYPLLDSGKIYYRIPITFWLYGYPPVSVKKVKHQVLLLNKYFSLNNTGIQFYLAQIIKIEKKSRNEVNYITEAPILTTFNRRRGTMNVHFIHILVKNNFGRRYFYSGVHNLLNKSIVLSLNIASTSLSHETGHFLGLKHPHNNWKKGKRKQECVSRTRTFPHSNVKICEVNGDGLRDTPAEPDLRNYTDDSCRYIGNLKDDWGDAYHPDTHNIMSYTKNKDCRYKFTRMQKAVMLYTAEHKKFSKYWRNTPENIHYTFDKYEPDNYRSIATMLSLNVPQYHTFHKSFLSPQMPSVDNDVDWFKFYSLDSTKYIISFLKGKYKFPEIKVFVFNSESTLDTLIFKEPNSCTLMLPSGYYFFKVKKVSAMKDGELFDYNIEIKPEK